jgi:pyruvate kinase
MNGKKTKIICTVSDRQCGVDFIRSLYENGMNVIRINSAHASLEGAQQIVDNVRAVSDKIAILIDTKGPEVRLTGISEPDGIPVKKGDVVYFRAGEEKESSKDGLFTNCRTFVRDVPVGARILIDDASLELHVTDKDTDRLVCEVCNNGSIKGKKSINVPDFHINLP